ncbi:uncharacterized protein B0H18DRAFT_973743 [Fomitopsis serialis]|uniref:uncharacterized protein n=1 Tax=Fomitopsis serialis TaxID=139415 RepID=UPI0020071F0B|nr:uncharacterized protein B0H18DRAFT_973743 [Neoantrodia serialis]KAH9936407.1 hypothetical protein B0H18DRAFT_973743 [Neoantrodia serialis]
MMKVRISIDGNAQSDSSIMICIVQPDNVILPTIFRVSPMVWSAGSATVDVTISAFMVYLLHRMRNEWAKTDLLVNRIIRMVIETGCVTVINAIAIVCFLWYIPAVASCFLLTLPKLYANSLLVSLNNRVLLRREASEVDLGFRLTLSVPK